MSGFADKASVQILWPWVLGRALVPHIINKRMTGPKLNYLYDPRRLRMPKGCAQLKGAKLDNVDKCSLSVKLCYYYLHVFVTVM